MSDISLSADVDTSGLAAGMAAIENQVQRTANSVAGMFSSAFSAGVIIAEVNKVLNAAEEIHKQAARFGIDAEQFQMVANAAKEMGISGDQVAQALNFIQINAQKALDPTTKQALAMEQLGISARAFAAASPWEKVLMLSQAYVDANDKAAAYAEITQIGSRRMTEFIALLAQGPDKIKEFAGQFPILTTQIIGSVHDIKVQEEQAIAELDNFFAKSVVGISLTIQLIKQELTNFTDWMKPWWNNLPDWAKTGNIFGGTMASGRVAAPGVWNPSAPTSPATGTTPASVPVNPSTPSSGVPPPVGVTDISARTGPGGGGGGGGIGGDWTSGLNITQKINELLQEREPIVAKLDSLDEQGDQHAASRYQLEQQRDAIDQQLLVLQQQLNIQETKGVQLADEKIQKSKDRVTIDELEMQLQAAEVNGNVVLAQQIQSQIDQTRIELDFNEKIQKAIDDANNARARGLELTAEENEKLAVQLETEKQITLEQQAQTDQLKARAAFAANLQRSTDAFGIMAREGINMGGSSSYAAALAASRGLKPGTAAYNRLVQQVSAQDELRILTGQNLSFSDQAARDQLLNWYGGTQNQSATQRAAASQQQEIAYWQAIATGHMPAANNPYIGQFGLPNLATGQFATPSDPNQIAAYLLPVFQGQGITLQQILAVLQQIKSQTEPVTVP